MRPVEIVLTDEQALMARLALDSLVSDDNYVMSEEETAEFERLSAFLGIVAEYPHKFPVTGKQAASVRSAVRRVRGAAQPQSRKNKRKARQERRQRYSKWRRRERKALAEQFNQAREIYEAEAKEVEAYWDELEQRIEKQAKFNIVTANGDTLVAGVPAEFIRKDDGTPAFPQLIVLGGE